MQLHWSMLSVAACPQDMDADVNTHASVYLSTLPLSPSLLCLCMLMQRTCATGKLLHIKSVSHGNEAQARPELSWAEQELQSNRIDGNFFSFAKVLRRMCHMDRSRNSSQTRPGQSTASPGPAAADAAAVHKCRTCLLLEQQPANLVSFVHF